MIIDINTFPILLYCCNGVCAGLKIDHICKITAKKTLLEYLNDLKPVLYLSTDPDSVREAIKAGERLNNLANKFKKKNIKVNYIYVTKLCH